MTKTETPTNQNHFINTLDTIIISERQFNKTSFGGGRCSNDHPVTYPTEGIPHSEPLPLLSFDSICRPAEVPTIEAETKPMVFPVRFYNYNPDYENFLRMEDRKFMLHNDRVGLLCHDYKAWMIDDLYLDLKITLDDGSTLNRCVLAPKRGNRMYSKVMKERLDGFIETLGTTTFFNNSNKRDLHITPMIKLTLTYDRNISRYDAWNNLSKDFNIFMQKLRQKYCMQLSHIRSYEAQADGYPHVHVDILIRNDYVTTRWMKNAWRVVAPFDNKDIEKMWTHGFIDLKAICGVEGIQDYSHPIREEPGKLTLTHDLKYITKDLTRSPDDSKAFLQMAILWKMGMRSFSMTRDFGANFNEICLLDKNGLANSNILAGLIPKNAVLVEFCGLLDGLSTVIRMGKPPPDVLVFSYDPETFKISDVIL